MKTITNILKTVSIFCFLLGSNALLAQTVITIDNNSGSTTTYQTIQEAIDNAAANDIIYVQPSPTAYGNASITKPLTIVGRSHSELGEISLFATVSIKSSNVTIKGISFGSLSYNNSGAITPPPYAGLRLYECKFGGGNFGASSGPNYADDIEVRGCLITGTVTIRASATNVLVSNNIFDRGSVNAHNVSTLVVANNIFRSNTSMTITNSNAANDTFILFNNMFITNSASDRVVTFNSGPFNLSNNLAYNYGTGNISFTNNGSGSFSESNTLANTNPLFTDVDPSVVSSFASASSSYIPAARLDDDLTLQAGSPALTAGVGGSELGVFSNGFNYKYLGNPRGVPTFNIVTSDGAVPKNGTINVTVTAKAH